MTDGKLFNTVAFIGIGLIGSSLARVMRRDGLAERIVVCARRDETLQKAQDLGLADHVTKDPAEAADCADIVLICTPIGTNGAIAQAIAPVLKPGQIVTDVGSVKQAVIDAVSPHMPEGVHFVPGHPLAGTENSGPENGFDTLFEGRWVVLTPPDGTDDGAVAKVKTMWECAGSNVDVLDAAHHDWVLAITSHLPTLIAFNIVGTVADLETSTKQEVIKYSATGFRDFTRIAAQDPVMWRDVYLHNREAVLEMLQRFSEDLSRLQRSIRWGEGEELEDLFKRSREIRRNIIDAGQA
ncbi:MAG: cyclohexadienyl dehydrogenase [Rhodospirillaceae bacterium]|nr:cyclohexadienyl dehydrogenase [Rhodospirillaceae bacterium]|tara:strand:+ start:1247 stop:2134 length:888 start_codon:yes stop_codon:yes gene_type:complete